MDGEIEAWWVVKGVMFQDECIYIDIILCSLRAVHAAMATCLTSCRMLPWQQRHLANCSFRNSKNWSWTLEMEQVTSTIHCHHLPHIPSTHCCPIHFLMVATIDTLVVLVLHLHIYIIALPPDTWLRAHTTLDRLGSYSATMRFQRCPGFSVK